MNIMNSERLLKIGDVATLLGVTTQTLGNWMNSGYMNAIIGKGGHRRFRSSEVERKILFNNNRRKRKSF